VQPSEGVEADYYLGTGGRFEDGEGAGEVLGA